MSDFFFVFINHRTFVKDFLVKAINYAMQSPFLNVLKNRNDLEVLEKPSLVTIIIGIGKLPHLLLNFWQLSEQ